MGRSNARWSGEDLFDDSAGDIGQPIIAAGVAISESLVIEPQAVEHGGVEVVGMDRPFGGKDAVFVGSAVDEAAADTAAGHP